MDYQISQPVVTQVLSLPASMLELKILLLTESQKQNACNEVISILEEIANQTNQ